MTFFRFIIFIIIQSTLFATPVVFQNSDEKKYNLAPYISLYKDATKKLTIDDVIIISDKFINPNSNFLYFHFTNDSYWLSFEVENSSMQTQELVVEISSSWLDSVSFYKPNSDSTFDIYQSGDHLLSDERTTNHRNIVFNFDIEPNKLTKYYIHIQSDDAMQIPIHISTSKRFFLDSDRTTLLLGIAFGIFILMVLYNLILYIYLRDTLYLVYALYVFFFLMMSLSVDGFGLYYIWIDQLQWNENSYNFFLMGYLGFYLLFTKLFLETKKFSIVIDRILSFGALTYFVLALLSFIIPYPIAMELGVYSAALIPFFIVIPSLYIINHGSFEAKYFLVGWFINIILYSIWAFAFFGVIEHTSISASANIIGVLAELLIFSFAIAFKIENVYRKKAELEFEVKIDPLTKLFNRRHFEDFFEKKVINLHENDKKFVFVMVDIDNFKLYNDTYGHKNGDEVLIRVANVLKDLHARYSTVFRLGGEEFGIILDVDNIEDAIRIIEDYRMKIVEKNIPFENSEHQIVTASFGVKLAKRIERLSYEEIYHEADKKLYLAKKDGRNRVKY